jgi:hypothetical protein
MSKEQIQAIGNFLLYYHDDLNYIKMFHDFKENRISFENYCEKATGTFYSFLIEYKIIRNIIKESTPKLLEKTYDWVHSGQDDNVDGFAKMLSQTELTRGNTLTSLASKILFLNNPWTILPVDTITRRVFGQRENNHSIYMKNVANYRKENKAMIEECLLYTKPLTVLIESDFKGKINDLKTIRENRIFDKLLLTTR